MHEEMTSKFCPRKLIPVLGLVVLTAALAAAPAEAQSPWVLLGDLRNQLQEAGPQTAKFVQTYIPAGFKSGDTESGHFSIWLPGCLRWNYEEPQEKSFLVCRGEVYFWNNDESGGRHYKISPEEEPGLDLLLVEVDQLRERYVASTEELAGGGYAISIAMPQGAEGSVRAKITLDRSKREVTGLEYTDEEGNLTRFEISGYQRLNHTALFQPPAGIEWTEEK